jgi:hypothetical protein
MCSDLYSDGTPQTAGLRIIHIKEKAFTDGKKHAYF